ncbi:MAG: hypothetical protein KIT44_06500 [Opitutaceae bacterium]|nr:hypothetical protein [Opitutaceae bacterium]
MNPNGNHLRCAFLWVILVVLIGQRSTATTVVPPEFADLVNQSELIVRAKVLGQEAQYERAGSRRIVTMVELEVVETIAGEAPRPLVLRVPGGRVGEAEMVVEGAPVFTTGAEYVLFIQGNGRQFYPLVAMMYGLYTVERTPDGRVIITRSNHVPLHDTAEVSLPLTTGGAAQILRRLGRPAEAMTPETFIERIRAAIKPNHPRLRDAR